MKKNIRYSVWETNSSLSHSLIIMSKEEFDKLSNLCKDDNYRWDREEEEWVKVENIKEEDLDGWRFADTYFDEEAEYEIEHYTTEHGDKVVAISMAKEDY